MIIAGIVFLVNILIENTYLKHFLIESVIVYIYLISFMLLSVLPRLKKELHLLFFGLILFGTAIFQWIHLVSYVRYYATGLVMTFDWWMCARSLFAVGAFLSALLYRYADKIKFKVDIKPIRGALLLASLCFLLSIALWMLFNAGANRNALILWYIAFSIFPILLLAASYLLCKEYKLLAIAFILEVVCWLIEINQLVGVVVIDAFLWRHIFVLCSSVFIGIWVFEKYVYTPYIQAYRLASTYNVNLEELVKEVLTREKILKISTVFKEKFLAVDNINDLKKLLNLLPGALEFKLGEKFVLFHKGKLIYRSINSLSDKESDYIGNSIWKTKKLDDFTIYYQGLDKTKLNLLLEILHSFRLKLEELSLKEELSRLVSELKRRDEYRVNFMRAISHEFKTPLSVIMGNVQLVEMGYYKDFSELGEACEAVKSAVWRMSELVDGLLDLARAETGRLTIKLENIHFDSLKEIVSQYEELACKKGLNFSFKFEGKEPFVSDFKMLSSILSNLLSNAVKYTDKGKIEGKFVVGKDKIVIEVADTGKGIDSHKLKYIFEPFQGEQTAVSSGLGLAIVKRFVELLKGTIKVESEVGKGTRFYIEIPKISDQGIKK